MCNVLFMQKKDRLIDGCCCCCDAVMLLGGKSCRSARFTANAAEVNFFSLLLIRKILTFLTLSCSFSFFVNSFLSRVRTPLPSTLLSSSTEDSQPQSPMQRKKRRKKRSALLTLSTHCCCCCDCDGLTNFEL